MLLFKEDEAQKHQESQSLPAPIMVQRSSRSNLSSTSLFSALSTQPPTSSVFTPPIYITDTVTPSPSKSSASRKSKRKFPDFRCRISVSFFCLRFGIIISLNICLVFPGLKASVVSRAKCSHSAVGILVPDPFNDYNWHFFQWPSQVSQQEEKWETPQTVHKQQVW